MSRGGGAGRAFEKRDLPEDFVRRGILTLYIELDPVPVVCGSVRRSYSPLKALTTSAPYYVSAEMGHRSMDVLDPRDPVGWWDT